MIPPKWAARAALAALSLPLVLYTALMVTLSYVDLPGCLVFEDDTFSCGKIVQPPPHWEIESMVTGYTLQYFTTPVRPR